MGLEGLLHISELSDEKIENPEDIVSVGDELEVKVLRVDTDERKIGLSRRRVDWSPEDEAKEAQREGGGNVTVAQASTSNVDAADLKGGLGTSGLLIQPKTEEAPAEETPAEEPAAEKAEEETEAAAEETTEE